MVLKKIKLFNCIRRNIPVPASVNKTHIVIKTEDQSPMKSLVGKQSPQKDNQGPEDTSEDIQGPEHTVKVIQQDTSEDS